MGKGLGLIIPYYGEANGKEHGNDMGTGRI